MAGPESQATLTTTADPCTSNREIATHELYGLRQITLENPAITCTRTLLQDHTENLSYLNVNSRPIVRGVKCMRHGFRGIKVIWVFVLAVTGALDAPEL